MMQKLCVILIGLGLGCSAPPKPEVFLPSVDSDLQAELVAQISAEDGMGDVRFLTVDGTLLYVAASGGLFIYDVQDPEAPTLLGQDPYGHADRVAVVGDRAYTIDVSGSDLLRVFDVRDPTAPTLVHEQEAISRIFSGLAGAPGMLWHAVGSNPPSQIYRTDDLSLSCSAPDQERGAMDISLVGDLAFVSVHFDDFAGDKLDGNGAFGIALFEVEQKASGCPKISPLEIIIAPTHFNNRSEFERGSSSDLQVAYDPESRALFMTGEQRVRRFVLDEDFQAEEVAYLDLPEVLDVAIDTSSSDGPVLGLANGDFLLVDAREDEALHFAGQIETPGIARGVAAAGDGAHFFVADSEGGIAVIRYEVAP
jgi:hypothetical protein